MASNKVNPRLSRPHDECADSNYWNTSTFNEPASASISPSFFFTSYISHHFSSQSKLRFSLLFKARQFPQTHNTITSTRYAMAFAVTSSAVHSSLSSSIDQPKDVHFGAFQALDRLNSATTAVNFSRRRWSVTPLNAEHNRHDSIVTAAATLSASCLLNAEEVAENVEEEDYGELAKELENSSPLEIMDKALEKFGNDIAIAFSGAEDVALLEYARLTGRPFRVFSLDTGRLNPETYRFFDEVEKHYGIRIEYMFPDAAEVQDLVRRKGLFSFYEDGHQECCRVRKVRPLRRALKGLRAWITGQRKDQSPGTRSEIPVVQVDPVFEGLDGGVGSLVKWNPVANAKGDNIWSFLRTMDVPVNSLHAKGYISIGCEPCTRAVLPGQHEREGRWWWEDAKAKECGLHKGNIKEENVNGGFHPNGTTAHTDLFESKSVVKLSRRGIENLVKLEKRSEAWVVVVYVPWCRFCQAMEESYVELAEKLAGSGVKVAKFRGDGEDKAFAQEQLQLGSFPTVLLFPKHASRPVKYPSEKRDVDSLLSFVNALE